MFIFHEGLPRSGKSYEAMVERIIPALKMGRKVYARLNGMDYDKIAECAEMSVERVRELLFEIPEEDVLKWAQIVTNDSLVILDEMQNFWPHGTARSMPQDQIKAISEHGHRGLDIVGMGQLLQGAGGVHPNWVNRCDQKIVFEKQNARGANDKYRWTAYKGTHNGTKIKFLKVNTGVKKYDKTYYGTYRTRVEGSENADTLKDDRTNIWTNPVIWKWIPIALIAAGVASWFLWYAFKGGGLEKSFTPKKKPATATASAPAAATSVPPGQATQQQASISPPKQPEKKQGEKDFIEELSEKYRLRVTAIIKSEKQQRAMFEWYDDSFHVRERLTLLALVKLGYQVDIDDSMDFATVTKGQLRYVATQFPNDPDGRISEAKQREIAGYPDRGQPFGDVPIAASRQSEKSSADGFGVLGKKGQGVRERPADADAMQYTPDQQQPRVPTNSKWRAL